MEKQDTEISKEFGNEANLEQLKDYCFQVGDKATNLAMDLLAVGIRLGGRGEQLDLNKDELAENLRALHAGLEAMEEVMFECDVMVTKAENMADAISGKKAGA